MTPDQFSALLSAGLLAALWAWWAIRRWTR